MSGETNEAPRAPDGGPAGCLMILGVLVLWTVCLLAAPLVLGAFGPLAGVATAVAAVGLWALVGPHPFPHLIPGLMGISVLALNTGYAVYCVCLGLI